LTSLKLKIKSDFFIFRKYIFMGLYAKPDASIGFNKKPKNVVFSIIEKDFRTF